jgi:DNA-binding FadR family transcriptional regulator
MGRRGGGGRSDSARQRDRPGVQPRSQYRATDQVTWPRRRSQPDFETIFIDDGSTGETPSRLDRLADEHDNINVLHGPNSGRPGRPRNLSQVQRLPFADQSAELLLQRIRSGEWPLGAKLPGGTTLAPQLGIGRSTLREAIRQLRGRGVLTARQGSGVVVISVHVVERWDMVVIRTHIVAVLEARIAIESEAARLVAQRHTPAELRGIRRALAQRSAWHGTHEELVDLDTAFHRSVVSAARNVLLLGIFDRFIPRSRQSMIETLRRHRRIDDASDGQAYAGLVDAVARQEPDAAADRSRQHLAALILAINGPGTGANSTG